MQISTDIISYVLYVRNSILYIYTLYVYCPAPGFLTSQHPWKPLLIHPWTTPSSFFPAHVFHGARIHILHSPMHCDLSHIPCLCCSFQSLWARRLADVEYPLQHCSFRKASGLWRKRKELISGQSSPESTQPRLCPSGQTPRQSPGWPPTVTSLPILNLCRQTPWSHRPLGVVCFYGPDLKFISFYFFIVCCGKFSKMPK